MMMTVSKLFVSKLSMTKQPIIKIAVSSIGTVLAIKGMLFIMSLLFIVG
jgi:hypothetical protein